MPTTFRVATLNIWNRFGPWEERMPILKAELARLSPDVIGLQEVLRLDEPLVDQLAMVSEGMAYHAAWGRHPERHDWPVGNAVLSRWPIKRHQAFALPDGGTEERRSLVFAEIEAPFGLLPFFVTHLNWKLDQGHIRVEQVKTITKLVRELAPDHGFPPVITGDFNADPESDEIRYLRGLTGLGGPCVQFHDCYGATCEGPGYTFARRNPFARLSHEPNRRIDYVFSRGSDDRYRGEPLEAAVCFDQDVDGVFPSDHFGVIATLSA